MNTTFITDECYACEYDNYYCHVSYCCLKRIIINKARNYDRHR